MSAGKLEVTGPANSIANRGKAGFSPGNEAVVVTQQRSREQTSKSLHVDEPFLGRKNFGPFAPTEPFKLIQFAKGIEKL